MIRLKVEWERPNCADGLYTVHAPGCLVAGLRWADDAGPLPDWTAFAFVPIDPSGRGVFRYTGGRAVPREATHVSVRAVGPDMTTAEETLIPLTLRRPASPVEGGVRLGFITDLHLAGKPWQVGRALALAGTGGGVLCAGDMVNDGTPEQFALLWQLIETRLGRDTPMLAVAGNHDFPVQPDAGEGFYALQDRLLDRAERQGLAVERDESGAWAVRLGDVDIIGLNAARPGRKLAFRREGQLPWLDRHLTDTPAAWHVVLCHAPLLAHNPQRRQTNDMPYFSRDGQLQRILEGHRNILFLSGHTHISVNCPTGCVETDQERSILYVNGGSVRTTTLKPEEPLRPKEWTEGNMLWLELAPGQAEITAVSLASGRRIARGYYRFGREETEWD